MARLEEREYTRIGDRQIVGTGLANSPEGVAWVLDIQRATYEDQPADTVAAQEAAVAADTKATGAQSAADTAQASADDASSRADTAQTRADAAYALADTKVSRDATPVWQMPTGTQTRNALATYTAPTASANYDPVQMQILMDSHQAWTRRMAALIADLIGNGALKD